jgi:hypothetical protein
MRGFRFCRGNNPPDWELVLDGKWHAVEVTRVYSKAQIDGVDVPAPKVESFLSGISQEVNRLAALNGQDLGGHVMKLDNLTLTKAERAAVIERAVNYIDENRSATDTAEITLASSDESEITIKKFRPGATKVSGLPSLWSEGALVTEEIEELRAALEERVSRKLGSCHKLPNPCILLLVDAFRWPGSWNGLLPSTASDFEAVFRAHGDYACELLSSSATMPWL